MAKLGLTKRPAHHAAAVFTFAQQAGAVLYQRQGKQLIAASA
jgi:hypothetical protein